MAPAATRVLILFSAQCPDISVRATGMATGMVQLTVGDSSVLEHLQSLAAGIGAGTIRVGGFRLPLGSSILIFRGSSCCSSGWGINRSGLDWRL